MTATGWYNLISAGTRNGQQDNNFGNARGVPQGDPYGSMAYLSVVVPNRINDGTSASCYSGPDAGPSTLAI